jgi:hypothetical protein
MEKKNVKPFTFRWKLFLAGLVAIIAGFALLATRELSISPFLLVGGYCILIPLSFL